MSENEQMSLDDAIDAINASIIHHDRAFAENIARKVIARLHLQIVDAEAFEALVQKVLVQMREQGGES